MPCCSSRPSLRKLEERSTNEREACAELNEELVELRAKHSECLQKLADPQRQLELEAEKSRVDEYQSEFQSIVETSAGLRQKFEEVRAAAAAASSPPKPPPEPSKDAKVQFVGSCWAFGLRQLSPHERNKEGEELFQREPVLARAEMESLRRKREGIGFEYQEQEAQIAASPAGKQRELVCKLRGERIDVTVRCGAVESRSQQRISSIRGHSMTVKELMKLGDQYTVGVSNLRDRNRQLWAESECLAEDVRRRQDRYWDEAPFRHLDMDKADFRKMKRRGYDDEGELASLASALREATESAAEAEWEAEQGPERSFTENASGLAPDLSGPSAPVATARAQAVETPKQKRRSEGVLVQSCHAFDRPPHSPQKEDSSSSAIPLPPERAHSPPPRSGASPVPARAGTPSWGQPPCTSRQDAQALAEAEAINMSLKDDIAFAREKLEQRALQQEIAAAQARSVDHLKPTPLPAIPESYRTVEMYYKALLRQEVSEMRERAQQRTLRDEISELTERAAKQQGFLGNHRMSLAAAAASDRQPPVAWAPLIDDHLPTQDFMQPAVEAFTGEGWQQAPQARLVWPHGRFIGAPVQIGAVA